MMSGKQNYQHQAAKFAAVSAVTLKTKKPPPTTHKSAPNVPVRAVNAANKNATVAPVQNKSAPNAPVPVALK